MVKFHTLASRLTASVVMVTAIALCACSVAIILVLKSSYLTLVEREVTLRADRASRVVDPALVPRALTRNPRSIGDDEIYLTLADQLALAVQSIPESSADLMTIEANGSDQVRYNCSYIMSVSRIGLLESDQPFNSPMACPSGAIESSGISQTSLVVKSSRFWIPDTITVYRPIKSGISTVAILAINFDISRVTNHQIKTFALILAVQGVVIAVVTIAIHRALRVSMDRLTLIVGACQDLAMQNYDLVSGLPVEMIDLDELDVLAIELKSAADRLKGTCKLDGF